MSDQMFAKYNPRHILTKLKNTSLLASIGVLYCYYNHCCVHRNRLKINTSEESMADNYIVVIARQLFYGQFQLMPSNNFFIY